MTELLERSPFDPEKERRIVIVADWLPPDFGAVGQYMQMRARSLAERGHDVTLVGLSSRAGSETHEARGKGALTEIRLPARPVPRDSLVGRMAWTIATDLRLLFGAFRRLRAADGILFTGSPPFLIHLLAPLKFLWRGRLVYRITDFHPECLIAERDRPSRPLGLLLALTNFWRRRVDGFEVLGEDQRRRLTATGVPSDRIALVRDGSPVSFGAEAQPRPLP
ncbi:MAG: glycosyltransferase, partial [Reyranella sp.]|nr:glycosyltransferase [Reyranella sp.]